jgi:hypothetical protein
MQQLELRAFRFAGEQTLYVTVSLPEAGCAAWGPPLSALFTSQANDGAAPVPYRVNAAELGTPALLLDLHADGRLSLIGTSPWGEPELRDEQGHVEQHWTTHDIGCRC